MLSPDLQYSHRFYANLSDVSGMVENQLAGAWVIRVEYTPKIEYLTTRWQQWGEAFINISEASGVIENISSCIIHNPLCAIRLHAEKFSPRSCLYFSICRAGCIPGDM